MMINDCYKILKEIENRPALFTGENTLKSINLFINGYHWCLTEYKLTANLSSEMDPFFDWVANKLGYFESTAGWVNMINAVSLDYVPNDINWNDFLKETITKEQHSKSINLFYELVEEFIKEQKL